MKLNALTEDEMMLACERLNALASLKDISLDEALAMPGDFVYKNVGFETENRIAYFYHANKFIILDLSHKAIKSKFDVDCTVNFNYEKKIEYVDNQSPYVKPYLFQFEEEIKFCQIYLKAVESESMYSLLKDSLSHKKAIEKAKASRKN